MKAGSLRKDPSAQQWLAIRTMALKFVVLLTVLATVRSQLTTFGSCPELKAVDNFDVDMFLGKWYELERYYSLLELGTICSQIEYKKTPEGKITAANSITARFTGINRVLNGEMTLADAEGKTGKLAIRYDQLPAHAYFQKLGIRPGFIQNVDQSCGDPTTAPPTVPGVAPATPEVAPAAPVAAPAAPVVPAAPEVAPAVRNQQVYVKHSADSNSVDVEDVKPVVPVVDEVAPVVVDVPADAPEEESVKEEKAPEPVEQPIPVPDVTPEEVKPVETDVVKAEAAEVEPVVEPAKSTVVEEPAKVQ
ncbi:hypothetical protein B566_EDAN016460 [Ephemera danica]|nr:hypothetical protein B566_EDAN016460 [Ephemera danica]